MPQYTAAETSLLIPSRRRGYPMVKHARALIAAGGASDSDVQFPHGAHALHSAASNRAIR
jgi:hypothetical protein